MNLLQGLLWPILLKFRKTVYWVAFNKMILQLNIILKFVSYRSAERSHKLQVGQLFKEPNLNYYHRQWQLIDNLGAHPFHVRADVSQ